jgi:hypothetical protein
VSDHAGEGAGMTTVTTTQPIRSTIPARPDRRVADYPAAALRWREERATDGARAIG